MDAVRLLALARRLPPPVAAAVGGALRAMPIADARVLGFLVTPSGAPDPWAQYRWLRSRRPVLRTASGVWVVTGHRAAASLVRHRATSVDDRTSPMFAPYHVERPVTRLLDATMLLSDPPAHDRRRRPVGRAFTPAKMAPLTAAVEQLADERVAALERRGRADILGEFAYPFTIDVICELLGVPAGDRWRFPAWATALARVLDALPDEDSLRAADRAAGEMVEYLTGRLDAFAPGDPGLLGHVAASRAAGDLEAYEAAANAALLLVAGYETTANLIANSVHALLQHPGQLSALRSGTVDTHRAVEELLRYCGPVQVVTRFASEPLTVDGVELPAGAPVAVLLAAANRDPEAFALPDELVLDRDPNPHLAFSAGIHSCLGAHLARLETGVAVSRLARRLGGLRLTESPARRRTLTIMGFERLDVSWAPASAPMAR